jgi:hypothetical protein
MLEVDFSDTANYTVAGSQPATYYRVYSSVDITNAKSHKWFCRGCELELPVRNVAELIEWLSFHKMLTWSPRYVERWPFSRAALINKGEISRKLLEDLYGSIYVPPDEATLIAQFHAQQSDTTT